jgi:hypothetical protein
MVGAGLFLAGSKTGQSATQKASEVASDLSDEALRRIHDLRDQLGESVAAASSFASDRLDRTTAAMSGASEEVKRAVRAGEQGSSTSFGTAAGDRVAAAGDQAAGVAGSATAAIKDLASSATSAGTKAAATTKDAGLHAARTVRETVSDFGDSAGTTFIRTVEQNPLLLASVGLLVGGLIASALPRSHIEDGLVGDTSTALKRRAQDAASQGFETAQNTVGEVIDEATRQAQEEVPSGMWLELA